MTRDRDRLDGIRRIARDLLGLTTDDVIALAMLSALDQREWATLGSLQRHHLLVWHSLEDQDDTATTGGDSQTDRAYDQYKDDQLGVL